MLRFIPTDKKKNHSPLEQKYGPYPVRHKDSLLKEMLDKEINKLLPYLNQEETKKKYDLLVEEKRGIFIDE